MNVSDSCRCAMPDELSRHAIIFFERQRLRQHMMPRRILADFLPPDFADAATLAAAGCFDEFDAYAIFPDALLMSRRDIADDAEAARCRIDTPAADARVDVIISHH